MAKRRAQKCFSVTCVALLSLSTVHRAGASARGLVTKLIDTGSHRSTHSTYRDTHTELPAKPSWAIYIGMVTCTIKIAYTECNYGYTHPVQLFNSTSPPANHQSSSTADRFLWLRKRP